MASILKHLIIRLISNLFDVVDSFLTKLGARKLKKQLLRETTDEFVELLLKAMAWSFKLEAVALFLKLIRKDDYQRHLRDSEGRYFEGRYLFRTAKQDGIVTSATFRNGRMHVHEDAIPEWDVKVTFTNGKALRKFLFSEDQDIINSLAENEVKVDGNLNYIYKFGFMAKDLLRRIELAVGNAGQ